MRRWIPLLLVAGLAGLMGCVSGPTYQRPQVTVPDVTRGQAGPAQAASFADQAWWGVFNDDALKGLIAEALRNGYDVRLAAARVAEAEANAGIVRAEAFPALTPQVQVGHGQSSLFSTGAGAVGTLAQVNLGLSWELDLWGRIRRANEAALAQVLASEEARRGVFLSLVSEVATTYFQLRQLDLQLEIARRTTDAFQGTFDLFNRRLQGGAASAVETASAEALLAATAANIPDLERQIVAQENRLAFLLGRNPGPIPRGAVLNDQFLPPDIPPGLPSDLLKRRPDIQEAEQLLIGANAEVGVAKADFFPQISLTAALGGVAPQLTELFRQGKTWSIGAGLFGPVLQPGRLRNQYRAAVARWEQARVRYEQSVNNSFNEVSTALVGYQKYAEVEKARAREVGAYQQAFRIANQRYVAGLSSYLEVLQAQQQLFPAEILLAQARYNRLATLVELYRALGGGWNLTDPQWVGGAPAQAGAKPGG
ncbi:MAG TPA: efflux transporter outer membrane subunit [Thermoanaerobaculia bacterium]|nr:efflux transporter outer membrane subunit [Thermoanaerobaculia bacterium]